MEQIQYIVGDKFIRKWRFYLASCQAAFIAGKISVMQVHLVKSKRR